MAEYIEREAALAICEKEYQERIRMSDWCGDTVAWNIGHEIKAIPSADVAPVRHGRWGHRWVCSNMTGYEYACSCSECGKPTYRMSVLEDMPPYCPNCGAKMDGGET